MHLQGILGEMVKTALLVQKAEGLIHPSLETGELGVNPGSVTAQELRIMEVLERVG